MHNHLDYTKHRGSFLFACNEDQRSATEARHRVRMCMFVFYIIPTPFLPPRLPCKMKAEANLRSPLLTVASSTAAGMGKEQHLMVSVEEEPVADLVLG